MRWIAILALMLAGLAASAEALPGRQTDIAYCSTHSDSSDRNWQRFCATRAWCNSHWNQDWFTRLACDPMRSRADSKKPRLALSAAQLEAARDLTPVETHLDCTPPFHSRDESLCQFGMLRLPVGEKDDRLPPATMKTAKLGLFAAIAVYTFPITQVRLGIASADSGTIEVSWNADGNGPRVTSSAALNAREIEGLVGALNGSDFWRLPHSGGHMPIPDGESAVVAVGIRGRQHQVGDAIGDSEAVDLSVLVNAVSLIIRNHWRNVPGG